MTVYYDVDTSDFEKQANILKIAALHKKTIFNCYVTLNQTINPDATKVTGLTSEDRELNIKKKKKSVTLNISDALHAFFYPYLVAVEKSCVSQAFYSGIFLLLIKTKKSILLIKNNNK